MSIFNVSQSRALVGPREPTGEKDAAWWVLKRFNIANNRPRDARFIESPDGTEHMVYIQDGDVILEDIPPDQRRGYCSGCLTGCIWCRGTYYEGEWVKNKRPRALSMSAHVSDINGKRVKDTAGNDIDQIPLPLTDQLQSPNGYMPVWIIASTNGSFVLLQRSELVNRAGCMVIIWITRTAPCGHHAHR